MTSAIIVAAGRGTRMGLSMDKLFLPVAGQPVIAHTWSRFDRMAAFDEILLVVREGQEGAFAELGAQLSLRKPYRLIAGGAERQDSVWQGLLALPPKAEVVAIQDGARPCTSEALVSAIVQSARDHGAAVAAQRVTDTIKESQDGTRITRHLDRTHLWSVQTPQAFRVPIIREALAAVRAQGLHVTDDTAACDLIGQPVRLIESSLPNPKVTVPTDIPWVELLLKGS